MFHFEICTWMFQLKIHSIDFRQLFILQKLGVWIYFDILEISDNLFSLI